MKFNCNVCGAEHEITVAGKGKANAPAVSRKAKAGVAPASTIPAASEPGDVGELLQAIDDSQLSGQSVGFVAQTRERYKKYGDRIRVSPKQIAWLQKIHEQQADAAPISDSDLPSNL
jgi:hypothetical protein